MSHKKLGAVKKKLRSARYDRAELLGLIRFLMALLATSTGKKKLSNDQKASLRMMESQLSRSTLTGVSKKQSRKRGKKHSTTTRRKPGRKSKKSRTAHQKRFAALARKYHGRIPKGTKV